MSIERVPGGFFVECDRCSSRLYGAESFMGAVELRREAGWERRKVNGMYEDLCPECVREERDT